MSALKGLLLGAANVIVIAIGIAAMERDAEVFVLVAMFGGVPGVVLGGLLGWLAGALATASRALRLFVLGAPAIILVFVLASLFEIMGAVLAACIPTCVAVLLLERLTRHTPAPPVPVARAMSATS